MTKRMLIDATHSEETRVAIIEGQRLEEIDFETSTKIQIKSNIYLAKIIRIEPSLQAAFIDYGGGRHGFLSFNEIHPDYFQIPIDDRQKLAEEAQKLQREAIDIVLDQADHQEDILIDTLEEPTDQPDQENDDEQDDPTEITLDLQSADSSFDLTEHSINAESREEEIPYRTLRIHRRYKIQEVIKRRQILLVQVIKEERGNKGAALTTYLSLAGRYCVLMPNSGKGGGISRKINDANDRKRLRKIIESIDIPNEMGVIVRTAGIKCTKLEIKRDYEYLIRLWEQIRNLTLKSIAPCLIHAEGSLIQRALRDMYSRDINQITIEGEDGFKMARSFMRMLMPSHAKRIELFQSSGTSLFHSFGIEQQIANMHSQTVELKSGGSIVICPTEALVAIDVNSGKATRERHIADTALKTNLEAADEIARQLRLRDLAGLVVVDFIDMDDSKHNHHVEKRFKDAIRADRARTQVGHISPFGLLELSRQRLRPSILETVSSPCSHCQGTGMIRSIESLALQILRHLEEEASQQKATLLTLYAPLEVTLFILNNKRQTILQLETLAQCPIIIQNDQTLIAPNFRIEGNKSALPVAKSSATTFKEFKDSAKTQDNDSSDELITEQTSITSNRPNNKRKRHRNRRAKNAQSNTVETTVDTPDITSAATTIVEAMDTDALSSQQQSDSPSLNIAIESNNDPAENKRHDHSRKRFRHNNHRRNRKARALDDNTHIKPDSSVITINMDSKNDVPIATPANKAPSRTPRHRTNTAVSSTKDDLRLISAGEQRATKTVATSEKKLSPETDKGVAQPSKKSRGWLKRLLDS